MNFLKFYCPDCGAHLEADENLTVFYCQYCGHKFVLDEAVKERLRNLDKERQRKHEEKMQSEEHSHESEMWDREFEREKWRKIEENKNKKNEIKNLFLVAILFAVFLIFLSWLMKVF